MKNLEKTKKKEKKLEMKKHRRTKGKKMMKKR